MSPRSGYLYVITAAVLWAVSGASSKFLFLSGVSPMQLVQLRISIAAGALLIGLSIWNPKLLKIDPIDLPYFAILGAAAMAAVQFAYLFAISRINVAAAILLQYLAPSLIALYSVAVAREKLRTTTVIALAGATSGCYLVVGAYNLNLFEMNVMGILGGLGAAVSFAWYSIQGEYGMRRYHPWTVLFYAVFFAAIVWNLLQAPFGAFTKTYSPVQWGLILYIALLGTILPFGLYFEAIRRIRATHASIAATLEPITAGLVSFIFLGESMEPLQLLGAILVIASVVLIQSGSHPNAGHP
ncbi:MAG: EamA family transporter [Desulfobacteraceae bacterium]|nr:MAG: EamA family transporter [Desulfobacteraceae bacterium]